MNEIFNINGITKGNGKEIPSFEDQNEDINITLESNKNYLINNLRIFDQEEKGNLNNETEEEIGPMIIEQLFYIKNINNVNKFLKKRFKITKKKEEEKNLNK